MSTRWYPLYRRGNPQLRIFLPNFWMKLIRSTEPQPSNIVQFEIPLQMTKFDVENYLEKIYKVPVLEVNTRITLGETKRCGKGYVIKEDDKKLAYVTLPKDTIFQFPNIFPDEEKKKEKDEKDIEIAKQNYRNNLEKNKHRPGIPSWFS